MIGQGKGGWSRRVGGREGKGDEKMEEEEVRGRWEKQAAWSRESKPANTSP